MSNVSSEKLRSSVLPQFEERLPKVTSSDTVSAILFIGEEVILSRRTQKGIDKLGEGTGIRRFALGYEFTLESIALLKQHEIEPIAIKEFGWTDERYIAIKSE